MIDIRVEISPAWFPKHVRIDLTRADAGTLRYHAFPGSLYFHVGDQDFSADWDGIPLLDLALCFGSIARDLKAGGVTTEFDFTESTAKIRFKRHENEVAVSCSYKPGVAKIPAQQVIDKLDVFGRQTVKRLSTMYEELRRNPTLAAELQRLNWRDVFDEVEC